MRRNVVRWAVVATAMAGLACGGLSGCSKRAVPPTPSVALSFLRGHKPLVKPSELYVKGIAYYHYNVSTDPVAAMRAAEAELSPQAGWSVKRRTWKGKSSLMLESRSVTGRRYVRVAVEQGQYKVNTGGYPVLATDQKGTAVKIMEGLPE